mgnify:CR=1 FL=1
MSDWDEYKDKLREDAKKFARLVGTIWRITDL